MSTGVHAELAARKLARRCAEFGTFHPATYAAYARACVATDGAIRPPRSIDGELPPGLWQRLCAAYTTADLRARGAVSFGNRHERKRRARADARAMANCAVYSYRIGSIRHTDGI